MLVTGLECVNLATVDVGYTALIAIGIERVTQPFILLQVFLNLVDFKWGVADAMAARAV